MKQVQIMEPKKRKVKIGDCCTVDTIFDIHNHVRDWTQEDIFDLYNVLSYAVEIHAEFKPIYNRLERYWEGKPEIIEFDLLDQIQEKLWKLGY